MNFDSVKQNGIEDEDYIDLLDLSRVLLRKWWMLLSALIVGGLIAGAISVMLITPTYKAESMIYVYSKTTSITSLTDLQIGSQLTVDFQIVATTREVVESVINKLGLDVTFEELLECIDISNPSNSHILTIEVTDTDPEQAAKIANTLADELRARIADVMNTDEPSMVQRAVTPTKKAAPSNTKNAIIGAVVAFVLVAGIIVVLYLLDDTIKTDEDVKKYLQLNTLAAIPKERDGKSKKVSSK